MTTITINMLDEVAAQIEAQHISPQQLDAFVVAALTAWLNRPRASKDEQRSMQERPWSAAFQGSTVDFVDQLIDENRALFEELSRYAP